MSGSDFGLRWRVVIAMATILGGGLALSGRQAWTQGMGGPPPHVHNWTVFTAIWAPVVMVGSEYLRSDGVVSVSVGSVIDFDYCDAPMCDYPGGPLQDDTTRITAWSDGGAGGQFGRLVGGNFVPEGNPQLVTHYEAGLSPQVAAISAQADDDANFADDAAVWGGGTEITVWELDITNGAVGWLPALDSFRNFQVRIRPPTDHLDQSMAAVITFRIASSQEPGFCINYTRIAGAPNDTVGNDLKFLEPQPGGLVVGSMDPMDPQNDLATTPGPLLTAIARVDCLDRAPRGSIWAQATIAGILQTARLVGSLTDVVAQIPVDENENSIADASAYDGGGAPGNEDLENDPVGDGTLGDGLSRYEEYRGAMIGGAYAQLDVLRKDVFVRNVNDLDATDLTTATLGAPVHYVRADEVSALCDVNFNTVHHRLDRQCAIRITNGGAVGGPHIWGAALAVGNYIPRNQVFCRVYVDTIEAGVADRNSRLRLGRLISSSRPILRWP